MGVILFVLLATKIVPHFVCIVWQKRKKNLYLGWQSSTSATCTASMHGPFAIVLCTAMYGECSTPDFNGCVRTGLDIPPTASARIRSTQKFGYRYTLPLSSPCSSCLKRGLAGNFDMYTPVDTLYVRLVRQIVWFSPGMDESKSAPRCQQATGCGQV